MAEHLHLLFLPTYSLELQTAEHFWPLTTTALINRLVASIEELENAQLARCAALQRRPDDTAEASGTLLLLPTSPRIARVWCEPAADHRPCAQQQEHVVCRLPWHVPCHVCSSGRLLGTPARGLLRGDSCAPRGRVASAP